MGLKVIALKNLLRELKNRYMLFFEKEYLLQEYFNDFHQIGFFGFALFEYFQCLYFIVYLDFISRKKP